MLAFMERGNSSRGRWWKGIGRLARTKGAHAAPVAPAPPAAPRAYAGPLAGVLGSTPFSLRQLDGQTVLRIGEWETVVGPDTQVRHRQHRLWNSFAVAALGRPTFVHRYHLPWGLQLLAQFESTPDFFVAQMDDPGLELTVELGGISAWSPATNAEC